MAKAIACVENCFSAGVGKVGVNFHVSVDSLGIEFGSSAMVNTASSTTQINSNIKAAVAQQVTDYCVSNSLQNPNLNPSTDVILFGSAS